MGSKDVVDVIEGGRLPNVREESRTTIDWRHNSAVSAADIVCRSVDFFGVHTGQKPPVCKSGIKIVDNLLGGLMPGSVSVIAARTKVGKTSLAIYFAMNAAINSGETVGLIHLEDELEIIGAKILSNMTAIDDLRIQTETLSDSEKQKVREAQERLRSYPLHVADVKKLDIKSVVQYMHDLKERGARTVTVDYLHGISPAAEYATNPMSAIENNLDRVKEAANELGIAVILIAHLNRAKMIQRGGEWQVSTSKPSVHDIRGSAMVENRCRLALLAWESYGQIRLEIALNSRGRTGDNMTFVRDVHGILRCV